MFSCWNKQGRSLDGTYCCRSIIVAVTEVLVTHTVGLIRLLNFGLVTVHVVLFLFKKFEMWTYWTKGQFSACFLFLCPNLSAFLFLTLHSTTFLVLLHLSQLLSNVLLASTAEYRNVYCLCFPFELMITFYLFMFYRVFQLFGICKQIAVVLFLNCSQRRQHVRLSSRHHVAPTLLPLCVRSQS